MYYTAIKHDRHLRTRVKCRKHKPQSSVFYISRFLKCSQMTGVFNHSVIHGLGFYILKKDNIIQSRIVYANLSLLQTRNLF